MIQPIFAPDAAAMRQHLEHLFGGFLDGFHDGLIELSWTKTTPEEDGKYKLNNARLFATDQLDELVDEAIKRNSQPMCNVYVGAALRRPGTAPFARASDPDAWALTCVYADLDDPAPAAGAKDVYGTLKPTMVVLTGRHPHTRAQLWWRLDEPLIDHGEWEATLRGIAVKLDADTSVCNPARVMRLAGTIAWPMKDGRTTELTGISQLKSPGQAEYGHAQITALFPPVEKVDAPPVGGNVAYTTNTLGLQNKLTDGREDYMHKTVRACLSEYIGETGAVPSPQDLFDIGWPQYERKVDFTRPGRGPKEFMAKCAYTIGRFKRGKIAGAETIESVISGYRARQPQPASSAPVARVVSDNSAPRGISISRVPHIDERTIPPRSWIIPGLLLEKYLSILVAPPGSGKSLLTLQWAISVCSGRDWGGWHIRAPKSTLVINVEDDRDEMYRRLSAAMRIMKTSHDDLGGRLFVADAPESIIIARTDSKLKTVVRTPLVEELVATINENSIGCVFVDPFAETFEGDENSNSEVKWAAILWREVARRTGASVMLVHHTKKFAGDMAGEADASRGGGALIGTARIVSTLFSMTEKEASVMDIDPDDRTKYVRFDDAKANLSLVTGQAKWFEKQTVALGNACGLIPGDEVGVLVPWKPPGMLEGASVHTLGQLLDSIDRGVMTDEGDATGQYFTTNSTAGDRWAGKQVKKFLGCDDGKAKKIIKEWLKTEVLETFEYPDKVLRKPRQGVRSVLNNRPGKVIQ